MNAGYADIYLYPEICNKDIRSQESFLFTSQTEEIQYEYP